MKRALGVLCALLMCGILIAGLWPFHHPKNEVRWLSGRNGIWLGDLGTLWSAAPIRSVSADSDCTLEVWVVPAAIDSGTILSVAAPGRPKQFAFRQSNLDLVFGSPGAGRLKFEVDDLFEPGKPLFITATAGASGTAVYVNGKLAKSSAEARFSFQDLQGTIILSGFATNHDAWPGEIRAIAIYNQQLQLHQVTENFTHWTMSGRPAITAEEHAAALYLFDEHSGSVVHNQIENQPPLLIPERYQVLEQIVLESPFTEFRPTWSYWEDVMVNVVGFIPFGFFFCAYFSWPHQRSWAWIATIFLGAATSLLIELLQSRLPTRDSSTTDVITNITGTCFGVALFAWVRSLLARNPTNVLSRIPSCRIEFK